MKKSLLTLGAVLGVSAGAFAQGQLDVETGTTSSGIQGFNTVSSNPLDSGASGTYSDYIDSSVTLEVFAQTTAADASLVSQAATINADDASGNVTGAATLLQADFVQMTYGASLGAETLQNTFATSFGQISSPATLNVGQATGQYALTSGATGLYAFLATTTIGGKTYEGVLVLNAEGAGNMGGGLNNAYNAGSTWPDNQNMFMAAPVPEPTTLALAGLGGLSLLALRRRKA